MRVQFYHRNASLHPETSMPKRKPTDPEPASASAAEPAADRPHISPAYGVPKHKKNLLPWSHVVERLEAAKYFWVATVDAQGRPHATPVDGIWLDNRLYFGGDPSTRRSRNLAQNPAACIHLENGLDVVILHGEVETLEAADRALSRRLAEITNQKYGYGLKVDKHDATGAQVFRPRLAFAWSNGLANATRWRL
jgi:nitroimidazol reductase NimA-like FMN-containing flavoprotein (pyridoxamine 5'-phosphate oxidase superfamily)